MSRLNVSVTFGHAHSRPHTIYSRAPTAVSDQYGSARDTELFSLPPSQGSGVLPSDMSGGILGCAGFPGGSSSLVSPE